jgi:hypothetical protein
MRGGKKKKPRKRGRNKPRKGLEGGVRRKEGKKRKLIS